PISGVRARLSVDVLPRLARVDGHRRRRGDPLPPHADGRLRRSTRSSTRGGGAGSAPHAHRGRTADLGETLLVVALLVLLAPLLLVGLGGRELALQLRFVLRGGQVCF